MNIGFTVQDRIATITIDRPDVRNALDEATA
jgi:enoyl-CoA hydratase/carnithine racemase